MTLPGAEEIAVRHAAFDYVARAAEASGGVVTRAELEAFVFRGEPMKLIDQSRGIRNPRQLTATLSILSQPEGPYDDEYTDDGLLRYAYRAGPIDSGDNRKLRRAAELGLRRAAHQASAAPTGISSPGNPRVLNAMHGVPLRHADLLDAAHIIPDNRPGGEPIVSNGLSLCKIHHAAYDRNIIGIRPDLVVEVKPNVLVEIDGPMLRHGIQEMAGQRIEIPPSRRDQPDRDRLAERYAEFAAAS